MQSNPFKTKYLQRPFGIVESRISLLVDALNAAPCVKTIGSCEGHILRGRAPYVYFSCTTDFAAEIARHIFNPEKGETKLHAYWSITGIFNEDQKLCFLLDSPQYENDLKRILQPIISSKKLRSHIDEDICTLATLVWKTCTQSRKGIEHKD